MKQEVEQPVIEFIDERRVRLVEDFHTHFSKGQEIYVYTVPRGFITDGASIPEIFWGFPFYFTPFQGKTLPAAVVHDHFYTNEIPPKSYADWTFYNLLKKYKAGYIKSLLYYIAVSNFGHYTHKNKEQ
jgi:hypothetical protein